VKFIIEDLQRTVLRKENSIVFQSQGSSDYSYCIFPTKSIFLSRRSLQRERLSASMLSICSSVCLFVCLFVRFSVAKMQKTRFSQKTKQFRAMVLQTHRWITMQLTQFTTKPFCDASKRVKPLIGASDLRWMPVWLTFWIIFWKMADTNLCLEMKSRNHFARYIFLLSLNF